MGPKVSIVIPVYNGSDFLDEAIQSALAQTYENIEIVVVNDGSNDGGATERIALGYGDRIRYFSKPNGGVASALNYAIQVMTGDFLSWLSHDDLYSREKIQRNIEALSALAEDERARTIIYSNYSVFSADPAKAIEVSLKGVQPQLFRYWLTIENGLHGCTLLIPKSAFQQCGVFNEELRTTQDYDLWFRMARRFQFVHMPQALVLARSHSGQGSITMAKTALQECNSLLSHFALDLWESELLAAGHASVSLAYASIAGSFLRRGFWQAGWTISSMAISHLNRERFKSVLPVLWTLGQSLAGSYVFRLARCLFPASRRLRIRNLLSSVRSMKSFKAVIDHNSSLKQKFSEIYDGNVFGGKVSRSGAGSDLVQTAVIRAELPALVKKLGVRSFMDAPCGDWYWMRSTELGVESYIGVDIVEAMIEMNQRHFGNAKTSFRCLNLVEDSLPPVDLVFSRDCLVHLSFADAEKAIANFKKSGSKYLLTTTFCTRDSNNDLVGKDSFWRPLNLQLAPFNFPPPLLIINERCTEDNGIYGDKCLGLWLLSDIQCGSHLQPPASATN